jgi:hypothetical protein
LPRNASWLNQVEIGSTLNRKRTHPGHFDSADRLSDRVIGFQAEYAQTRRPLTERSAAATCTRS